MLEKNYDAQKFERDIYAQWENAGVFKPRTSTERRSAFPTHINILPPPNANGSLHLGHASGYTIMDIAGRFARMNGKETLLLPGKDHAGILTQTVFEKLLLKEKGKTRHDLGREEFYKQCYQFCLDSAEIMRSQEKRIGLSADWSREKFTLDPEISKDVLETFVEMYKQGIAYKGNRIINWCPFCQTALSDMEVEHKDQTSKFYWIKYGPFTLATARPETKLGDTAVAVHPSDERYKHMIGKKYMIPGVLGEFEVTVVGDEAVDPAFGTGAVKVTPAHSFVDFEIAQRHGIESKMIINKEGRMMENCGKYAGMTTKECREAIVEDMKAMGLIEKIDENYVNKISVHDRCGNIIEPLISEQWWMDTDHPSFSLKKHAIDAVKTGKVKIIPEHFEKTFYHWMENLQPWCISRQLWWGHQIPAFYCEDCENMDVTLGEKTEFIFLRHGQTDLNAQEILQGSKENPSLNELGRKQVENQIAKIKELNPDVILSSPMIRAQESAQIIAQSLGKEIITEEGLRERDFGDYSGQLAMEVKKQTGVNQFQEIHFQDMPNGESYSDFTTRLKNLFDELEEKYKGKKVLLVAHGGLLRVLRHTEKKESIEAAIATPTPNAGIEIFSRYETPTQCSKCGGKVTQDPDTFDTWFSSGQWAHNTVCTFGENQYFPGDFMVMGRDILFFWACRMMMMSLYYSKGEKVPFKTLYLTGLITDRDGKKMSKSKGNGIDPLEMADKYGTDALRLSLFIGSSAGNDMRLYEEKIEGFRNFINKLWNASRFVQMSLENGEPRTEKSSNSQLSSPNSDLSEADKWILSRTNKLIAEVTEALENYRYSEAGQKLYDFTWNQFCDWYLELSKGEKQNVSVLQEVLKTLLTLLHPFCPFVTEVLWQELGFKTNSGVSTPESLLALTSWPTQKPEWNFPDAEENIELIVELITAIRSLRSESKVDPVKKISGIIFAQGKQRNLFEENADEIAKLARFEKLEILESGKTTEQTVSQIISHGIEIHLPLAGMVDLAQEKARLQKEIEAAIQQLANLDARLSNEKYMSSAPANLVEQTRNQRKETAEKIEKLQTQLEKTDISSS